MTAKTLTEDGWVMTGDMFYRDDYWHFYFIDRLKSLLKYKNFQVSSFVFVNSLGPSIAEHSPSL